MGKHVRESGGVFDIDLVSKAERGKIDSRAVSVPGMGCYYVVDAHRVDYYLLPFFTSNTITPGLSYCRHWVGTHEPEIYGMTTAYSMVTNACT